MAPSELAIDKASFYRTCADPSLQRDSQFSAKHRSRASVIATTAHGEIGVSYSTHRFGTAVDFAIVRHVATIRVNDDADAGKIIAFLVNRDRLRESDRSFHYWVNVVGSDGTFTFANALLDRCGMLKPRLYNTFGAETNQGNILYIRNITLKKKYRRRTIGCKALKRFVQMVCTDVTKPNMDEWWLAVMHNEPCEDTWRPAGFRIISGTCYLASCAQQGHKCRDEKQPDPPLLDVDIPEPPPIGHTQRNVSIIRSLVSGVHTPDRVYGVEGTIADFKTSRFMHYAAATREKWSIPWLKCLLKEGATVHEQDHAGNTPLHVAAHSGSPRVVKFLLQEGADCTIKNKRGHTPLDVCALEMEYQRECSDMLPSGFRCHEERFMLVIEHLALLTHVTGKKAPKWTMPYPRSKLGCTCRKCLMGFFSPRMKYRLQQSALSGYAENMGLLDSTSVKLPMVSPEGLTYDLEDIWQWEYIPAFLRQKATVGFIKGWISVLKLCYELLEHDMEPIIVPTARQLMVCVDVLLRKPAQACPEHAVGKCLEYYLLQGGRIEYGIQAVVAFSHQTNEVTGGGELLLDPACKKELDGLPICANDNDYTFLLKNLCDDGLVPTGPYCPPDPPIMRVTESLSSAFVDDNIRAYL